MRELASGMRQLAGTKNEVPDGSRPMALSLIATRISRSALAPRFPCNSE